VCVFEALAFIFLQFLAHEDDHLPRQAWYKRPETLETRTAARTAAATTDAVGASQSFASAPRAPQMVRTYIICALQNIE
jgi:hypothetical protein